MRPATRSLAGDRGWAEVPRFNSRTRPLRAMPHTADEDMPEVEVDDWVAVAGGSCRRVRDAAVDG